MNPTTGVNIEDYFIECSACGGSGHYCGRKCSACNGTAKNSILNNTATTKSMRFKSFVM